MQQSQNIKTTKQESFPLITRSAKQYTLILFYSTRDSVSPNGRQDRDTATARTRSAGLSRHMNTIVDVSGPSHSRRSQQFSITRNLIDAKTTERNPSQPPPPDSAYHRASKPKERRRKGQKGRERCLAKAADEI